MKQTRRTTVYDPALGIEAYRLQGFPRPFPPHFHDYYVIGYVEAGTRRMVCGGQAWTVRRGDLLVFQPGEVHACVQAGRGSLSYRGLNVPPAVMEHLAGELARTGQTFAVWGAGHQGFTLAATTCLGQTARYIIDSAPFKQGRYAPASHLPIVSPEQALADPPDAILIAAPGYTEEIADEIRRRFPASVRILALRSDRLEELAGKRPQFDETKG